MTLWTRETLLALSNHFLILINNIAIAQMYGLFLIIKNLGNFTYFWRKQGQKAYKNQYNIYIWKKFIQI